MEKIVKRKAVFRVEFEVYSCSDEGYNLMCQHINLFLRTLKEVYDNEHYAIGRVIPHKIRRLAR